MAALLICIFYEPYRTRTTSINELTIFCKRNRRFSSGFNNFFPSELLCKQVLVLSCHLCPKNSFHFPTLLLLAFSRELNHHRVISGNTPDIYYKSYYYQRHSIAPPCKQDIGSYTQKDSFQKSQYNNKKGLEIATEQCKDKLSNFGGIFVTLGKVLELSKFSGFVFNSSYSKYSCTHHICKNKKKNS